MFDIQTIVTYFYTLIPTTLVICVVVAFFLVVGALVEISISRNKDEKYLGLWINFFIASITLGAMALTGLPASISYESLYSVTKG